MTTIDGTAGNDILEATAYGDLVRGLAGDDVLTSVFLDTTLQGGLGADYLSVSVLRSPYDARATLDGGPGGDVLTAALSVDNEWGPAKATNVLLGGVGIDTLKAVALATVERGISLPFDPEAVAAASNRLSGGVDRDILHVRSSATGIRGGDANAENVLQGGAGNDDLIASAVAYSPASEARASNTLIGGAGDDRMQAEAGSGLLENGHNSASNVLYGDGGDDVMTAKGVSGSEYDFTAVTNRLHGGAGNDVMNAEGIAGTPHDSLDGRTTNVLYGGEGDDRLQAIADDDTDGRNTLMGDSGNDSLEAFATAEARWASALASNALFGGSGNDNLSAEASAAAPGQGEGAADATAANTLYGDSGDDILAATADARGYAGVGSPTASNVLHGGSGSDSLTATARAMIEAFNPAVDPLPMAKASNSLFGGAGDDRLEATAAATRSADSINRLDGGVGSDILVGRIITDVSPVSRSHSELFGGADADTLSVFGGRSNILDGGAGDDALTCGDGPDVCVFRRNYGDDSVGGFDEGADKIRLLGFGIDSFADLTLLAQGANTVIDLPTDTSVTVLDLAPDQLGADDFLFA